MLKKYLFLVILFISIEGLAMNVKIAVIKSENFPTAFIGDDRVFPFNPGEKEIEKMEIRIKAFLKSEHPIIYKKFSTYFRQYRGIEGGAGNKKILAQFFEKVDEPSWRSKWIEKDATTSKSVRFCYNVQKDEVLNFSTTDK